MLAGHRNSKMILEEEGEGMAAAVVVREAVALRVVVARQWTKKQVIKRASGDISDALFTDIKLGFPADKTYCA